MSELWLRYTMQCSTLPDALSPSRYLQVAVEQAAWVDDKGVSRLNFGEHHGSADGYTPSSLMLAAAFAPSTQRVRLNAVVLLPYHDPIRVAEDVLVLDSISGGRAEVTIGLGYAPSEMALFGIKLADRLKLVEEKLPVLRRALRGERFTFDGREVFVAPAAVQKPNPPIYGGGTLPASARRAARLADGFSPVGLTPELRDAYLAECAKCGVQAGEVLDGSGPINVYVAEDPDKAWHEVGPYFLAQQQSYRAWTTNNETISAEKTQPGAAGAFRDFISKEVFVVDELRAAGTYLILTPDECVEHVRAAFAAGRLVQIEPLVSGLPAELSWPSLDLLVSNVLPRAKLQGASSAANSSLNHV